MEHHFDVDVAEQYWIEEAIILYNLKYWLIKNIANEVNLYDWYYWTYNSTKAFSKIFPYMSEKKISRILLDLEDKWVIKSWNYNKSPYDKTKWYTIRQKEIIDCSFLSNRVTESVQPIPDNKQYNKQYTLSNDNDSSANSKINTNSTNNESLVNVNKKELPTSKELVNEKENKKRKSDIDWIDIDKQFEWFWKLYPRNEWKKTARDSFMKKIKSTEDLFLLAFGLKKRLEEEKKKWTDPKFYPHCTTWLNQERFRDYEEQYNKQSVSLPATTNNEIKLEDQDNVDWL